MVMENAMIGFACKIFMLPAISPGQEKSMDVSHSTGKTQCSCVHRFYIVETKGFDINEQNWG